MRLEGGAQAGDVLGGDVLPQTAADEFLRFLVAQHVGEGRVGKDAGAILPGNGNALQGALHQGPVVRFTLPQGLFGLFALGNVTDNRAKKSAIARLPTRERQFHRKFIAVPGQSVHFERFPHETLLTRGHDTVEPIETGPAVAGRHQHSQGLPHHLVAPIAKQALGTMIPRQHDAVRICRNNGIHSRLSDRAEAFLTLAHLRVQRGILHGRRRQIGQDTQRFHLPQCEGTPPLGSTDT